MFNIFSALLIDKYVEIEKQLIDDFRRAYYDGDLQRMKNITSILSNFKVICVYNVQFLYLFLLCVNLTKVESDCGISLCQTNYQQSLVLKCCFEILS